MRRTFLAWSASALILALSGCSGSSAPAQIQPLAGTPNATTGSAMLPATAPSSPTASPTPTVLTKAEAGKLYLQLVVPANKALSALQAEEKKAHPSLSRLRAKSKALGDALATLLRQVSAASWPESVQADVDKLSDDISLELTAARAAQKAKSLSTYDAAWSGYQQSGAAQKIRAKLGLGEVPS